MTNLFRGNRSLLLVRLNDEPLFSILDAMRQDPDSRFWRESMEASEENRDMEEDLGQEGTVVKIVLPVSPNTFQAPSSTSNEGHAL